jgi:UDP-N-acetyl-D-galactosamine dehydrogenase
MNLSKSDTHIAVVGLGYVGLPLAVEFGKKFTTVGFDIDSKRVGELKKGIDRTLECDPEDITASSSLIFSSSIEAIKECNVYIVTVPTPIDKQNRPDLMPLIKASEMLGGVISKGDCIIYESTVYPGATEEVCVPILEKESKLIFNKDFFVGYSPERINPGDRLHRLRDILKVTSGSNEEAALFVDSLYGEIILAGTHKAGSIKVAEAAKVIENTQRDVNIALVNELSIIFSKLSIDTEEVLEAAGTKWNFLPFRPGLVGGHCIGVDPYYLTHKAISVGYNPEIILAGRRLNDDMPKHVVSAFIKQMLMKSIHVVGSKVLILGLSFKENCPDIRNTKIVDVINELKEYSVEVDVYDPCVNADDALNEYGISILPEEPKEKYDGILFLVAHNEFKGLSKDDLQLLCKPQCVIYDLKYILDKSHSDVRL